MSTALPLVSESYTEQHSRLFVKNLPEKINKTELKRALYMLFSTYGPVLDIVTGRVGAKGQHMRGQAHIVFRDIQTSTQAMRALQAFDFFGKEMVRGHINNVRDNYLTCATGHRLWEGPVEHNSKTSRDLRAS